MYKYPLRQVHTNFKLIHTYTNKTNIYCHIQIIELHNIVCTQVER